MYEGTLYGLDSECIKLHSESVYSLIERNIVIPKTSPIHMSMIIYLYYLNWEYFLLPSENLQDWIACQPSIV